MLAVLPEVDMVICRVNRQTAQLSSIICPLYMEHVHSGVGRDSDKSGSDLEPNNGMFLTGQDRMLS